jgi:hypothetical protein
MSEPTLDVLLRDYLRARQVARSLPTGSVEWEAAVNRAERAGSECLARVIELEAEVVPAGRATAEDRPISVLIAEAVVALAPTRALGASRYVPEARR